MPNFPGVISATSGQVKVAQKGVFSLPGSKMYSTFHKIVVLDSSRDFVGSKTVIFGANTAVKTVGQLFP